MQRMLLILLMPLIVSCTFGAGANLNVTKELKFGKGDFEQNQVYANTVLGRFIMQPAVVSEQKRTPKLLRLSEKDLLTQEKDLNSDGKIDIIGTMDNYKFKKDGGYPLYILIADEYDYHRVNTDARTSNFKVKVQETSTNGFKDLSVDGKILKFDGEIYK